MNSRSDTIFYNIIDKISLKSMRHLILKAAFGIIHANVSILIKSTRRSGALLCLNSIFTFGSWSTERVQTVISHIVFENGCIFSNKTTNQRRTVKHTSDANNNSGTTTNTVSLSARPIHKTSISPVSQNTELLMKDNDLPPRPVATLDNQYIPNVDINSVHSDLISLNKTVEEHT